MQSLCLRLPENRGLMRSPVPTLAQIHGKLGFVPGKPRRASLVPICSMSGPETVHVASSTRALSTAVASSDFRVDSLEGSSLGTAILEERIEKVIYGCRFFTFLGIIGSLMGSILCFLKGCVYVVDSFTEYFLSSGRVIPMLIEAIDIYLIGTVMLVFGMGLYELFISNLDIVKTSSYGSNLFGLFQLQERPKWLKIQSVNELKTKLGHVIVMVLLVGLFEKSKKATISSASDLLYFAASILLSSGCLYLLSRLHTSKGGKHT
ncbi:uncharacterized protein [Typha angustifolia]|uniref:uncharacterized protein n=1 Tax=Typha angustifolia TaxID=59011 RepID=UPI003C2E5053